MTHIYLAAPLFSQAEQKFNLEIYHYLLKQHNSVFLPQQECRNKSNEDIYQTCLAGLSSASVVVAILDGADADSGTCWECGYAVARDIPVIAVRTDFRGSGDTKGFNAMLYFSAFVVIENRENYLEAIADSIQEIIEKNSTQSIQK